MFIHTHTKDCEEFSITSFYFLSFYLSSFLSYFILFLSHLYYSFYIDYT